MLADKTVHQFRLEPKLFGIGYVLPGAAAARTDTRFGVEAEVAASRDDSVRRRAENLDERGHRPAAPAVDDANRHTLAGDRERNG
jgi:hypothetical protein